MMKGGVGAWVRGEQSRGSTDGYEDDGYMLLIPVEEM